MRADRRVVNLVGDVPVAADRLVVATVVVASATMGTMKPAPELLGPLIEHTRRVLRAMDTDEVPAGLRRVAAHSGPRLPPPLLRRLVDELDASQWLRDRVVEAWDDPDPEASDPAQEASELFLTRPDGWEGRLAELDRGVAGVREAERQAVLEAEVDRLRDEVERSRRKARRAQRELELAEAEASQRITAARSAAASVRDDERREFEGLRREVGNLRGAVEEAHRDLIDSRERVRGLRSELLRARRAAQPAPRPPERSVWSTLGPVDAARLLDDVHRALSPAAEFVESELPLERSRPVLPAGVAPDAADAVGWVLGLDVGYSFIVDGYNVTHLLAPGSAGSAEVRGRLNSELANLRRLAVRNPAVVVVYDSAQIGGITTMTGPGGVEVRFTTEGHSADDEILLLATELGAGAVVVSSDRRVREGAERVGAIGLWGEALVEWIRRA